MVLAIQYQRSITHVPTGHVRLFTHTHTRDTWYTSLLPGRQLVNITVRTLALISVFYYPWRSGDSLQQKMIKCSNKVPEVTEHPTSMASFCWHYWSGLTISGYLVGILLKTQTNKNYNYNKQCFTTTKWKLKCTLKKFT